MKLVLLVLLSVLSYQCCTGYPVVVDEISENNLTENGTSIEYWLDSSNETDSNDSSTLDMYGFGKKVYEEVKDKVKDGFNKVKDKIKDSKDILNFIALSFADGISDDNLSENGTNIEYWLDASNETDSNDSSPLDMHGFGKKVVNKVKDGIKTAKDGIKTVKDKMKDGFNKVKDKIKDFKDKIGSKGGGSGGGYYRDKYDRDYDRDYNRDKYDRDYNRDKYDRDNNRNKYDRDSYHKDNGYSGGSGSPSSMTVMGIVLGIIALAAVVVIILYCYIEH